MTLSRCILAIALTGVLTGSSAAASKHNMPTLRDQEQAACSNDAMKLCKDDVPDEAKIEACMRTKISQVSAGCRKYFKQ